jgi:hypothetical protein
VAPGFLGSERAEHAQADAARSAFEAVLNEKELLAARHHADAEAG